jgi:hypothetical protein
LVKIDSKACFGLSEALPIVSDTLTMASLAIGIKAKFTPFVLVEQVVRLADVAFRASLPEHFVCPYFLREAQNQTCAMFS